MRSATTDDNIPTEFFEAIMKAQEDPYDIVRQIFEDEAIPDDLQGAKEGLS